MNTHFGNAVIDHLYLINAVIDHLYLIRNDANKAMRRQDAGMVRPWQQRTAIDIIFDAVDSF